MNIKEVEQRIETIKTSFNELKSNPESGLLKDKLKQELIIMYDMISADTGVSNLVEEKVLTPNVTMKFQEAKIEKPVLVHDELTADEELEEEAELVDEVEALEEEVIEENDNSFDLFTEMLYGKEEEKESTENVVNEPVLVEEEKEEVIEETIKVVHEEVETVLNEKEETDNEISFIEKVRETQTDKIEEYKNKPIDSLATTIPIGKKFEFIEDLFIGNSDEYSRAIKEIDTMPEFKDAESYLMQNYFDKYGWMEKEKVLNTLFDFVNRRFAA